MAKAEEGTLFLDEIGDLAPESQIKLLRLLQEREYYPLGTDRPRPTTARFVFATNLDIAKETAGGKFRKDLLYRLRSHHIRIPPLRERAGDLPALVDHFLDKASQGRRQEHAHGAEGAPPAAAQLSVSRQHPRARRIDLRRRGPSSVDGPVAGQLPKCDRRTIGERRGEGAGSCTAEEENIFGACQSLPTLKEAGKLLIEESLRRADGNQDAAARLLGLTRTALNRALNRKP